MYRRILCLGLLGCFSQGVYAAACKVNVSLSASAVEFNPFNPVATELTLEVAHDGEDHTDVTVSFDHPLIGAPSSTLGTYRHYIIEYDGTEVFDSDDNTTTFSTIASDDLTGGGSRSSYTLYVTPDSQPGNETALAALASGSVTLPVKVEGVDSSSTVCSGTENVTMNVSVPARRAVALSNSFSSGDTSASLDAGTLGSTSVTQTSTLYMWSNTKYTISAESDNNGVMVRSGGSADAVNKLPYTLTFGTTTPFTLGEGDTTVTSSEEEPTIVNGKQINISFTTEDTGKRAGTYSDTVTVRIHQSP